MSPVRLCLAPRCPNPVAYRGYCRSHVKEPKRAGRAIYSKARWRNTRKRVLAEQPLCGCGEIATDVHHKIDLADGGDPWKLENLEALCHRCHSRITRLKQG